MNGNRPTTSTVACPVRQKEDPMLHCPSMHPFSAHAVNMFSHTPVVPVVRLLVDQELSLCFCCCGFAANVPPALASTGLN